MSSDFSIKLALFIYNLCWKIIIPLLNLNERLAEGFNQRTLKNRVPLKADLWIQAASAGEAYLAEAIIRKFKSDQPVKVLLTSGTKQGVGILQHAINAVPLKNNIIGHASFFPFDQPDIMEKAVIKINPKVMVLLESEMWPGHLYSLKNFGCKTIIINGRITDKSLKKYLLWRSFWNSIKPGRTYAISEEDADRFGKLFGKETVSVMPNIKFDGLERDATESYSENPVERIISPDIPFVVLGSVREKEEPLVERIILDIIKRKPETVIGLFPRHFHRIRHWSDLLERMNIKWILRSQITQPSENGIVILWDTFGELAPAYKNANAAFVGGSLVPLGGQNFLEAINYGVIPVIGPFWDNFSWVGTEIINEGLIHIASDWQETANVLIEHINNPPSREKTINAANKYMKARQGGTAFACKIIEDLLNKL
jgi:3-deoxy-D-manno-octulosonic-acid transferase